MRCHAAIQTLYLLRLLALGCAAWLLIPGLSTAKGPPDLEPPSASVLAEARALVQSMKERARGPYEHLRWVCKDGTVHPPRPYPCTDRGGGNQYGWYSRDRNRLADLGWHVGTVFTALSWQDLWDGDRRNQRLRELSLESFLVDIDDGWVLRRAQTYRGRVQIEDEQAFGRKHLIQLLSKSDWVDANFLLAREAVRSIPHHGGVDRTRTFRRLSKEIAAKDATFEPIRIKLHTRPGPEDTALVEDWLDDRKARKLPSVLLSKTTTLVEELTRLYGADSRAQQWTTKLTKLKNCDCTTQLVPLLDGILDATLERRISALSEALRIIRDFVTNSRKGDTNLTLLDLSVGVESELLKASYERLSERSLTRRQLLEIATHLTNAGYGAGFLSDRERRAIIEPIQTQLGAPKIAPADYLAVTRRIEQAGGWSQAIVWYTFAEAMTRYCALEAKSTRFPDDLLRGSAMLPLAQLAATLTRDADRELGLTQRVFQGDLHGIRGLNPGLALGRLHLATDDELASPPIGASGQIIVLPRAISDLDPVAGIITLGGGNVLSHVQMLARNLGIPNAQLPASSLDLLRRHDGARVMLAVASDGSVVLERLDQLSPATKAALTAATDGTNRAKTAAPRPDLTLTRSLTLTDDAGVLNSNVVGPKAAYLAKLERIFPDSVVAAIAVPFGVFSEHVDGDNSPRARLVAAFERHRRGDLNDDKLAEEVALLHGTIEAMSLSEETRERLAQQMAKEFGPPGTYGLFIRSSTNVEDLPNFTGAGLNRTIPNVVGIDAQLAAIPLVWASPFTKRAMAWRSEALDRPEEVYSSALLMKSVPSDKSGVLVTADVASGGEGLTVAVSWGVGGAVDGEASETLVLRDDGAYDLISETRSPYHRRLPQSGGVSWQPAIAGTVLTQGERDTLREVARVAIAELAPVLGPDGTPLPWDIEFGFVAGKLYLFQVRPLIGLGESTADRVVQSTGKSAPRETPELSLSVQPWRPANVAKESQP